MVYEVIKGANRARQERSTGGGANNPFGSGFAACPNINTRIANASDSYNKNYNNNDNSNTITVGVPEMSNGDSAVGATYVVHDGRIRAPILQHGTSIAHHAPILGHGRQVMQLFQNPQQQQQGIYQGLQQVRVPSQPQPMQAVPPPQMHTQYVYAADSQPRVIYLSRQHQTHQLDNANVTYVKDPTSQNLMNNSNQGSDIYIMNSPAPTCNSDAVSKVVYSNASHQQMRSSSHHPTAPPTQMDSQQNFHYQTVPSHSFKPPGYNSMQEKSPLLKTVKSNGMKAINSLPRSNVVAPNLSSYSVPLSSLAKGSKTEHRLVNIEKQPSAIKLPSATSSLKQISLKRNSGIPSYDIITDTKKKLQSINHFSKKTRVTSADVIQKVNTTEIVGNTKEASRDDGTVGGQMMKEVQEWVCDVCMIAVFPTFAEADAHEKICLQTSTVARANKSSDTTNGNRHDGFLVKGKKWRYDKGGGASFSSYEDVVKRGCEESENSISLLSNQQSIFSVTQPDDSKILGTETHADEIVIAEQGNRSSGTQKVVFPRDKTLFPKFLYTLFSQFQRCEFYDDGKSDYQQRNGSLGLMCSHCNTSDNSIFPTKASELPDSSKMFLHVMKCQGLSDDFKEKLIRMHFSLKEEMKDKKDWEAIFKKNIALHSGAYIAATSYKNGQLE